MDAAAIMQRLGENLSVGRAFGTAYERGDTLVIPVARVAGGGGGGGSEPAGPGEGLALPPGGGGGFGGVVRPLGVYVVRGDDVRWVPAVDATRVALASIAVFGVFATVAVCLRALSSRRTTIG